MISDFAQAAPKFILIFLLVIFLATGIYHVVKPLPSGLNYVSMPVDVPDQDIHFLRDLTYLNAQKERKHEQEIFTEIFTIIDKAKKYILLDMFLLNDFSRGDVFRPLYGEMIESLAKAQKENPSLKIDLITDPINIVYGGDNLPQLDNLSSLGVNVIYADLSKLRDSNPFYSFFWHFFFQWMGNSQRFGFLPHPFSSEEEGVTLRSYLRMLNLKANHRKVFLADQEGEEIISVITSANPHDGSSAHSNVALKINSHEFAQAVYISEKAVARFSSSELAPFPDVDTKENKGIEKDSSKSLVAILTEAQIKQKTLGLIQNTQRDDQLFLTFFYLSHRQIINALIQAAQRGVEVEIVFDPNKDAFGFEKNGVPNRPVAEELINKSQDKIKVRWYATQGEQFHSKMLFVKRKSNQKVQVLLGSANLTRRNLDNYNLETNVLVKGNINSSWAVEIEQYFNRIWNNEDESVYTYDYSKFGESSFLKRWQYLIQEEAGLSSF